MSADKERLPGVYVQDFIPGQKTSSTRRRLAGFDPENPTESFALSPDGSRITLAVGGPRRDPVRTQVLPSGEVC